MKIFGSQVGANWPQEIYEKAKNALSRKGGTMEGAIDMASNTLTGVKAPAGNTDAANKKYVDDTVSNAGNIKSGTLGVERLPTVPISKGGTGATDAATARKNLGAAPSSHNHSAENITTGTLSSDRLPSVPVAKGGTGATTAAAARSNLEITPARIGAVAVSDFMTKYNLELWFTEGVCDYSNAFFDKYTKVVVIRRAGEYMSGLAFVIGTHSYDGYITIVLNTNFTGRVFVNLFAYKGDN